MMTENIQGGLLESEKEELVIKDNRDCLLFSNKTSICMYLQEFFRQPSDISP